MHLLSLFRFRRGSGVPPIQPLCPHEERVLETLRNRRKQRARFEQEEAR